MVMVRAFKTIGMLRKRKSLSRLLRLTARTKMLTAIPAADYCRAALTRCAPKWETRICARIFVYRERLVRTGQSGGSLNRAYRCCAHASWGLSFGW